MTKFYSSSSGSTMAMKWLMVFSVFMCAYGQEDSPCAQCKSLTLWEKDILRRLKVCEAKSENLNAGLGHDLATLEGKLMTNLTSLSMLIQNHSCPPTVFCPNEKLFEKKEEFGPVDCFGISDLSNRMDDLQDSSKKVVKVVSEVKVDVFKSWNASRSVLNKLDAVLLASDGQTNSIDDNRYNILAALTMDMGGMVFCLQTSFFIVFSAEYDAANILYAFTFFSEGPCAMSQRQCRNSRQSLAPV